MTVKRERVFKNTFAPSCRNQELSASDIVTGMRFGVFRYRHLPPEVRVAVDEEIRRMKDEARRRNADDWELHMLDLGMVVARHEDHRPQTPLAKEHTRVSQASPGFLGACFKQVIPVQATWSWQLQDRTVGVESRRNLCAIYHVPYGAQPDKTFVRAR